jgi:hypothetical protein
MIGGMLHAARARPRRWRARRQSCRTSGRSSCGPASWPPRRARRWPPCWTGARATCPWPAWQPLALWRLKVVWSLRGIQPRVRVTAPAGIWICAVDWPRLAVVDVWSPSQACMRGIDTESRSHVHSQNEQSTPGTALRPAAAQPRPSRRPPAEGRRGAGRYARACHLASAHAGGLLEPLYRLHAARLKALRLPAPPLADLARCARAAHADSGPAG